jgi:hypothetical protein
MAINRISGNILQDDLRRGSDLAIQGNLIYFDIQNNRVGVRTSTPTDDFEVDGVLRVGNVTITDIGNIDAGGVNINNLAGPVANSDAATKFYVDAAAANSDIGNFVFDSNTISLTVSPADISIQPTGNSLVIIDTTSGMIMPVGDTAERPISPQTGTLRFNTNTGFLEVYNGIAWDSIETGFDVSNQVITPDGVSSSFVLDQNTTAQNILVSINGVSQIPINNYTVSGNVLTMTETPLSTDIIDVRFITAVSTTGTVSPGQAGRLARYATTGSVITDSGADLTWNGNSLVVSGQVITDEFVVGNTVSLPGAVVRIDSTGSMIVPVGDTAQRPATPVSGMIRFNQQLTELEFYDGTAWRSAATQFTTVISEDFLADGSTVSFVLGQSATTDQVLVSINGVLQIPSLAYSVSGNVLLFAAPPEDLDIISARIITTTQASPGVVSTGQADRLARYAVTGATVTDSGADLTWDGTRLDIGGNTKITGSYIQIPVYADSTARDLAISSPMPGMIVLTGNIFTGYDGSTWRDFHN